MRTMEFTNWREHEQAQNLCQLRAAARRRHATRNALLCLPDPG
jgi:hypothetical protein